MFGNRWQSRLEYQHDYPHRLAFAGKEDSQSDDAFLQFWPAIFLEAPKGERFAESRSSIRVTEKCPGGRLRCLGVGGSCC